MAVEIQQEEYFKVVILIHRVELLLSNQDQYLVNLLQNKCLYSFLLLACSRKAKNMTQSVTQTAVELSFLSLIWHFTQKVDILQLNSVKLYVLCETIDKH